MKIVKLMGGLGNQMFQYAFAKSLGEDVLFDNFWFNQKGNINHAIYGLEDFNTNVSIATKEQIKECLNESVMAQYLINIYKIGGFKVFQTNRVYEKIRNKFQPELLQLNKNSYYDGYFQCPLYFNNIKSRLINDFKLKKELTSENLKILNKIHKTNSIAISIRCKEDYYKLGWCLSWSYYNNALNYIAERIENPVFYLFADDIEKAVKEINIQNKFKIIPCKSFDENCNYSCGINLMSNCKHNIIANSSYSWWGAWLNNNNNKIVVAPQKWIPINGIIKTTYSELISSEWIKM